MTDPIGRFVPVHAAHAIEQVVVGFLWARPLDADEMKALRVASDALKDRLPGLVEIRTLSVALGKVQQQVGLPVPAGFVRQESARDGTVINELIVENTGIQFRTNVYTRWATVWKDVSSAFQVLMDALPDTTDIQLTSLQYTDKFIWEGTPNDARTTKLFRPSSPYLAPHAYEATDLWHSHTGFFERRDPVTKRLTAINVDCVDETTDAGVRRVVRIVTALSDIFGQEGYEPVNVPARAGREMLAEHQSQLHARSKDIFGKIVTDEAAARVALYPNGDV